jgi:hypothetical protein
MTGMNTIGHGPTLQEQIAQAAAVMAVEEGLEWGAAKRRAVKQLGLPARTALPDNDLVEEAVREHIALYCADTQPSELQAITATKPSAKSGGAAERGVCGRACSQPVKGSSSKKGASIMTRSIFSMTAARAAAPPTCSPTTTTWATSWMVAPAYSPKSCADMPSCV